MLMRLVLLAMCSALALSAQNPFWEAMMRSVQMNHEKELLQMQLDAEAKMQRERLERQQQQVSLDRAKQATPSQMTTAQSKAMDEAVAAVRNRHPDILDYAAEIQRVSQVFSAGPAKDFSVEEYLEG